jgi:hypothetical protein
MIEVFRRYPRSVFTAMGLSALRRTHPITVITFSLTYLFKVEVSSTPRQITSACCQLVASAIESHCDAAQRKLSDRSSDVVPSI